MFFIILPFQITKSTSLLARLCFNSSTNLLCLSCCRNWLEQAIKVALSCPFSSATSKGLCRGCSLLVFFLPRQNTVVVGTFMSYTVLQRSTKKPLSDCVLVCSGTLYKIRFFSLPFSVTHQQCLMQLQKNQE